MRITKFTHACVRLEKDDAILVVDPGEWTEDAAFDAADAVLITHEHADHVDVARLSALDVPVYAPADAAIDSLETLPLRAGDTIDLAGFTVRAVGGRHAIIVDAKPDCANLGYLVDDRMYHPGDALHVPDQPVETLLVPAAAPWLKLAEAVEFGRTVRHERAFQIHDGMLNERGQASVRGWFTREIGATFGWLAPGESA